jgi:C1A family cysteine protease
MQRHKYLLKADLRNPEKEKNFSDFLRVAPKSLPKSTDFRSNLPPIWDQGDLGACQSYAIDAIDQYIKGYKFTPSHIFTYYNVRKISGEPADEDTGGTLSDTCQAVKKYGICNSDIWPNDNSKFSIEPSTAAYKDGLDGNDNLVEFYRIDSVDQARQALAMGHLPYIGITVYENFETNEVMQSGIIPAPAGEVLGGHALVIAGYQDNSKLKSVFNSKHSAGSLIIRNSWGTGIGLNGSGYFKVSYEDFEKLVMDMWIIVK